MSAHPPVTPTMPRPAVYAEELTHKDVDALEAFLNTHLGRVYDEVGPTGETSFAVRSLLVLVCDSVGLLHALLRVERPDTWQQSMIVREWRRLRGTALDFNHCEGYDHDRWWDQVEHYDSAAERAEQERIRSAVNASAAPAP